MRSDPYRFSDDLVGITAQELLEKNFPPRWHVIDPWLRNGETAIIWAASGVGKTMLGLSLAVALAGGGEVGEWRAPRALKVLYVDGEMHEQDIQDRLKMLADTTAVEITDPDAYRKNLSFVIRQAQDPDKEFYDLTDRERQRALAERCKRLGTKVLIIDNFTTVSDGLEDENASVAFKSVQSFFLSMKQMGIATILIHHSRKDGQALRGSQAMEVTFEVILGLSKDHLGSPGQASFIAKFQKNRSRGDARLEPRLWTLTDRDGWRLSDDVPEDAAKDAVIHAVRSLEFVSQTEIAERLGLNKSTVSRRISRAEARGDLKLNEAHDCFEQATKLRDGGLVDSVLQDMSDDF